MSWLITYQRAQKRILRAVELLPAVKLPLDKARGLVLARDIVADRDLPPFDRSAMDGYAVRAADTAGAPVKMKVAGEIVPGREPDADAGPGEAARIMTGAPVPPWADAVQIVEVCRESDGFVVIGERVEPGRNIAPRGEDASAGDVLLEAGALVTPGVAALAASVGAVEIDVRRRPRVTIAATGDELVDRGSSPSPAQIRNANGPSLAARLQAAGAEVHDGGITSDTREEISRVISEGPSADAVVLSGGVSKGRYDFVKDVLEEAGADILFSGVSMKPGKPTTAAMLGGSLVFALPGNPVSCLVTAELFVVPALRAMMGMASPLPLIIRAELLGGIAADSDRTFFYPAKLGWQDGVPGVTPVRYHGSGDFADFAGAEALVIVPPQRDLQRNEIVDIIPLGSAGGSLG
ncbi:MAG TPA: gephyrin-like molybdotransferase Glp [Acidobacteriota bacterium]|nr:gephyrin-like molybdotransferase Glp [Acidobacteriota bacterium]